MAFQRHPNLVAARVQKYQLCVSMNLCGSNLSFHVGSLRSPAMKLLPSVKQTAQKKTVKGKSVKRGTNVEPLCAFCKKRRHYRTRCPALAQALLKAATKHSSVSSLEVFVRIGKTLKVNVPKKPQRTLKSARGKRIFPHTEECYE